MQSAIVFATKKECKEEKEKFWNVDLETAKNAFFHKSFYLKEKYKLELLKGQNSFTFKTLSLAMFPPNWPTTMLVK